MIDTEFDVEPAYPRPVTGPINVRTEGGGTYSHVDQSVNKRLPWSTLLGIVSGVAIAFSIFSLMQSSEAKREARMVEYYLMDPHSRTPEEMASWAKFQKEREQR